MSWWQWALGFVLGYALHYWQCRRWRALDRVATAWMPALTIKPRAWFQLGKAIENNDVKFPDPRPMSQEELEDVAYKIARHNTKPLALDALDNDEERSPR